MLLTTIEQIPGRTYTVIGLVKGSCVQSKNAIADIGQSLKTIVGGELKSYTDMMNKARQIAEERMMEQAAHYGADAIVGVLYATSAIMGGAAEITVYGTAVKLN